MAPGPPPPSPTSPSPTSPLLHCPLLCLPCVPRLKGSWHWRGRRLGWGRGARALEPQEVEAEASTSSSRQEASQPSGHAPTLTCACRKCSLISLGDVDTREVTSMIKFIKQNKVESVHFLPEIRGCPSGRPLLPKPVKTRSSIYFRGSVQTWTNALDWW